MAQQNQITPKVFLHLDSHARKTDGKSKFFLRVEIGRSKRTYRLDLNGQDPIYMKKKFWENILDPETGKKTREKQIQHVRGNGGSRQVERDLFNGEQRMRSLIKDLGDKNKTITHDVLEKLWQRKKVGIFSDWATKWSETYCEDRGLSAKTKENYQLLIRAIRFYEEYAGSVAIQAISIDWFRSLQSWFSRPMKKNKHGHLKGMGWSNTNRSIMIRKIGTMFKNAVLDGEINHNPYREFVDRGLYENYAKEKINFLEEEHIDRMYEAYMSGELLDYETNWSHNRKLKIGPTLHARLGIYLFTIYTGLRYSDVCNVAIEGHEYVSISKTMLTVVMQKSIRAGKDGKEVRLKITQKMRDVCNLSGVGSVFLTRMIDTSNNNKNLRKILKILGINKYLTFHDLRRTFATSLLTKGARMKMVSALVGHSSIVTTEKSYGKVIDKARDETMELWDTVQSSFSNPEVKEFVEDVFGLLQDNPSIEVPKRLLDKIEALSDLLQLARMKKEAFQKPEKIQVVA